MKARCNGITVMLHGFTQLSVIGYSIFIWVCAVPKLSLGIQETLLCDWFGYKLRASELLQQSPTQQDINACVTLFTNVSNLRHN